MKSTHYKKVKYFALLLLLCASIAGYSQWSNPNVNYGDIKLRGAFSKALLLPDTCGAPSSTLRFADIGLAALQFDTCAGILYVYNPASSVKAWQGIVGSNNIDSTINYYLSDTTNQYDVIDVKNAAPTSPATNDVYRVGTNPTGTFAGHANQIATWNGSAWSYYTPQSGDFSFNQANTTNYQYRGAGKGWIAKSRPWLYGGNKFYAPGVIGTNDNYGLIFRTNKSERFSISNTGVLKAPNYASADTTIGMYAPDGTFIKVPKTRYISGSGVSGDFMLRVNPVSAGNVNFQGADTAVARIEHFPKVIISGDSLFFNTTIYSGFTSSSRLDLAGQDYANLASNITRVTATNKAYVGRADSSSFIEAANNRIRIGGLTNQALTSNSRYMIVDSVTKIVSYLSLPSGATDTSDWYHPSATRTLNKRISDTIGIGFTAGATLYRKLNVNGGIYASESSEFNGLNIHPSTTPGGGGWGINQDPATGNLVFNNNSYSLQVPDLYATGDIRTTPYVASGNYWMAGAFSTQQGVSSTPYLGSTVTLATKNTIGVTQTNYAAVNANNSYATTVWGGTNVQKAASGNHDFFTNILLKPIVPISGSAALKYNTALIITDSSTGGVLGNYSIFATKDASPVRIDGGLQLGSLPEGSTSDSVLLVSGTIVKKIAATDFGASTGYVDSTAYVLQSNFDNYTDNIAPGIYPTKVNTPGFIYKSADTLFQPNQTLDTVRYVRIDTIGVNSSNKAVVKGTSKNLSVDISSLTANRNLKIQDKSYTAADSADVSVMMPLLSDISALIAYTGTSSLVYVTDTLRGGPFNIYSSSSGSSLSPVDSGIVFRLANGKYAVRNLNNADKIFTTWWEGVVPDYNTTTGTGTNSTRGIQKAIDYAANDKKKRWEVFTRAGLYLIDSVFVPEGIIFSGVNGFSEQNIYGGTKFYQKAGSNHSAITCYNRDTAQVGSKYWYGGLHDFSLQGSVTDTACYAITFRGRDGIAQSIQDQNEIKNITIRYFRNGGVEMPGGGGIPVAFYNIKGLWNGGPLFSISNSSTSSQSACDASFINCGGDGNVGGFLYLKNLTKNATINITNARTEYRDGNSFTGTYEQQNPIVAVNCDSTKITINTMLVVSTVDSGTGTFKKPGDVVKYSGTGTPDVDWRGVTVRVRSTDLGTDPVIVSGSGISYNKSYGHFPVDNSAGATDGNIIPAANNVYGLGTTTYNYTSINAVSLRSNTSLSFYAKDGVTRYGVFTSNGNFMLQNSGTFTDNGSRLQVGGSLSLAYAAKTSAYTLTASDYAIECTSGTFTVTAPTAASITGRRYSIANTGSGTITLSGTSSQTFNGNTTVTITQGHGVVFYSNGTNWTIESQY